MELRGSAGDSGDDEIKAFHRRGAEAQRTQKRLSRRLGGELCFFGHGENSLCHGEFQGLRRAGWLLRLYGLIWRCFCRSFSRCNSPRSDTSPFGFCRCHISSPSVLSFYFGRDSHARFYTMGVQELLKVGNSVSAKATYANVGNAGLLGSPGAKAEFRYTEKLRCFDLRND